MRHRRLVGALATALTLFGLGWFSLAAPAARADSQSQIVVSGALTGTMTGVSVNCGAARSNTGFISASGDLAGTHYLLTVSNPADPNGSVSLFAPDGSGPHATGGTSGVLSYDAASGTSIRATLSDLAGPLLVTATLVCNSAASPSATPAAASPPPVAVAPSSGQSGDSSIVVPVLLIVVAILLVAGVLGALIQLLRRTPAHPAPAPPPPRGSSGLFDFSLPGTDRLFDSARKLSAPHRPPEMARAVMREALALVPADSAGVIRNLDGLMTLACESVPGAFDTSQTSPLLAHVVATGQATADVAAMDPVFPRGPVAVAAVPLMTNGAVAALLVLTRSVESEFTLDDRDLLLGYAPVAASALDRADTAEAMIEERLTDGLTAIGNRRRLDEEGPAIISATSPAPTTLMMIDIDHFKQVNDSHGHPAGDAVLRSVAVSLQLAIRPDDRLYRYGGEEFCIILPEVDPVAAASVCTRILKAVASTRVRSGSQSIAVTVSIGLATSSTQTLQSLIHDADQALYRAKRTGRNRALLHTESDRVVAAPILGPTFEQQAM